MSAASPGYCPEVTSWPAVARALDRILLGHSSRFTHEVAFRRCPRCAVRNIVREADFVCVFCGGELPQMWNVDDGSARP